EQARGAGLAPVESGIAPADREPFLEALARLEHERRRDGAYAWGVFEDAAQEGRILETFLIESWMEHLRQHERVTKADRLLQGELRRFDQSGNPKVTHFIAADNDRSCDQLPVGVYRRVFAARKGSRGRWGVTGSWVKTPGHCSASSMAAATAAPAALAPPSPAPLTPSELSGLGASSLISTSIGGISRAVGIV